MNDGIKSYKDDPQKIRDALRPRVVDYTLPNNGVIKLCIPRDIYIRERREMVVGLTRLVFALPIKRNKMTWSAFELAFVLTGVRELPNSKYVELTLMQEYTVDLMDPNGYRTIEW